MAHKTSDYSDCLVSDQIILYDTQVFNWLKTDFDIIPYKSTTFMINTPNRGYAFPITNLNSTQERLKLPRVVLTRIGDPSINPTRFNPALVRKLGKVPYTNDAIYKYYQAKYPVPIIINYQIDFWCEFIREINLWVQKLLFQFAFNYKYFEVIINSGDTMWGTKKFSLFFDGNINDLSDMEPDDRKLEFRKSIDLKAECWLFDQKSIETNIVKNIQVDFYESNTENKIDSTNTSLDQEIYLSNGMQTIFTGSILNHKPVLKNSLLIKFNLGGLERTVFDNGQGIIVGTNLNSGTVNYNDGGVDLNFITPPDAGGITAYWLL